MTKTTPMIDLLIEQKAYTKTTEVKDFWDMDEDDRLCEAKQVELDECPTAEDIEAIKKDIIAQQAIIDKYDDIDTDEAEDKVDEALSAMRDLKSMLTK